MKIKVDGRMYEVNDGEMALATIKDSNPFTADQTIEEYITGLRKRLCQCTGELVNPKNYLGIINALVRNNIIEVLN